MTAFRLRRLGGDGHKYALVGRENVQRSSSWAKKHSRLLVASVGLVGIALLFFVGSYRSAADSKLTSCDTMSHGFVCVPEISQFWGQYSPYFSVHSDVSREIPAQCDVTFAQILSRHGARDPTSSKSALYNATIHKIQTTVETFSGNYSFLKNYRYTLGADQLTWFGQQQMVYSGVKFYDRYQALARDTVPFVRSSGQTRVVESAQNWILGFNHAKRVDESATHDSGAYSYINVVIPEDDYGVNNTLNHDLCTQFENGTASFVADDAQNTWANIFATPIQERLNVNLQGADLSLDDTIYMMDLCPFNTVAAELGDISPFCSLFSEDEWHQYNYYESIGKWYGYSHGNPLGPTQGVGFVNELIARMTNQSVHDHTSTNHTLDGNPESFPLGRKLYADMSHDNDITAILSAIGLYNETAQLPNDTVHEAPAANGYSASWTVPFAARVYIEKLDCRGYDEELVRVIVNDRVQPLTQCRGDSLGRCTLNAFIDSLAFAKMGGHWNQCFS